MNELLTVKQFAKEANITRSAIYQRLKTSLKPYYIERNGVKYIQRAALEVIIKGVQEPLQGVQDELQGVQDELQGVQGSFSRSIQEQLQDVQDELQGVKGELETALNENRRLNERIAEQKETNERLQKELDEARADIKHKDELLEAQSARLLSITEKQQELLFNQQVLQAQTQKKGFFKRLFAPKDTTSK